MFVRERTGMAENINKHITFRAIVCGTLYFPRGASLALVIDPASIHWASHSTRGNSCAAGPRGLLVAVAMGALSPQISLILALGARRASYTLMCLPLGSASCERARTPPVIDHPLSRAT